MCTESIKSPRKGKAPYTLTSPCAKCPFRSDAGPYLREERAREIADGLRAGGEFTCHQTVDYKDNADGVTEGEIGKRARVCAGALITMEKDKPNQMMRIAERLGLYVPEAMDMDAPVYDSLAQWVRAHGTTQVAIDAEGEAVEYEHCGVVGDNCSDPAGFMNFGAVMENDQQPTCNPLTDSCNNCGTLCCENCFISVTSDFSSETIRICVTCSEDGYGDLYE